MDSIARSEAEREATAGWNAGCRNRCDQVVISSVAAPASGAPPGAPALAGPPPATSPSTSLVDRDQCTRLPRPVFTNKDNVSGRKFRFVEATSMPSAVSVGAGTARSRWTSDLFRDPAPLGTGSVGPGSVVSARRSDFPATDRPRIPASLPSPSARPTTPPSCRAAVHPQDTPATPSEASATMAAAPSFRPRRSAEPAPRAAAVHPPPLCSSPSPRRPAPACVEAPVRDRPLAPSAALPTPRTSSCLSTCRGSHASCRSRWRRPVRCRRSCRSGPSP
jgi:hypothetical protein